MSGYRYSLATKGEAGDVDLNYGVDLPTVELAVPYQMYANSLVAAAIAKMAEYMLEEAGGNANAMRDGAAKITAAIAEI